MHNDEWWVMGPGRERRVSDEDWGIAVLEEARHQLDNAHEPGALYIMCPGCELRVHHTDMTAHARECAPLRALAEEVG